MRLGAAWVLVLLWTGPVQGPWFGTWKLNFEKSSSNGSDRRYKRMTLRIEPWQDGLRVIYDMVGPRGEVSHLEWTGKFDGRDYPVEGVDYVLTSAYSPVDDHAYQIAVKVDGTPAATTKVAISADGKTLTTLTTEMNAQGQKVTSTAVYDRVD